MMNTAALLESGTTVGSYRVHRLLAEGGMAMVYEAAHLILPRRVALKVMHDYLITSPQASQRILQEACILEAFCHPHAVRVYECGILADRRPWIAMELVGGEPLSAMLSRVGALPISAILTMMATIADVVAAAHRNGIVHRDLKPENVLVTGAELDNLRVIDWGIARQPVNARLTLENFTLGTPTYMAPEQARGLLVDGRADVYALGVMAYEAATGRPPFQADNAIALVLKHLNEPPQPVRSLRPDLPPGLAWLIDSMLEKDPAARPTAAAVSARLARLMQLAADTADSTGADYAEYAYERNDAAVDEYAEIVVTNDDDDAQDDDDYEVVIDVEPPLAMLSSDDGLSATQLDFLIAELEVEAVAATAAADAEAARVAENQQSRRRGLSRRWTPPHLVAAVTAYCDEPRRRPGLLVIPRSQYDAVSGDIDRKD